MTRGMLTVAVVVVLATATAAAAPPDVEDLLFDLQIIPLDGEPAPEFALEPAQGPTVRLADLRGQVVLLYFWLTS